MKITSGIIEKEKLSWYFAVIFFQKTDNRYKFNSYENNYFK